MVESTELLGVGDYLSDITLFEYLSKATEDDPAGPKAWRLTDLAQHKKVVVVGVIGAFTPVCHNSHLPGYIKLYKHFSKKGIDEIWCVAVNDPFVLNAWGDSLKSKHKVRFLSDGAAELVSQLGATLDLSSRGMGVRSDRFVMVVDKGQIIDFVKEDPGMFQVTDAESVLERL